MLIITRKIDEGITIDGGINIKIIDIRGETVKIGIEAPRQTLILRDELVKTIEDENIQSAANSQSELLDDLVSSLSAYKKDL